jgi:predicted CXXCH cytochrome family protein
MAPGTLSRQCRPDHDILQSLCIVCALLFVVIIPSAAFSAEVDCLPCHKKLVQEKNVHPAVPMGCPTCHTGIDASKAPHKKKNTIARGLSADQPDLCYGCHDKALFTKKNVHAAVAMGCTGCHNPHSSKNSKLLVSAAPALCFTCHDKAGFSRKNVHAPVAAGMCLDCHNPHSTDFMDLLAKEPVELCLGCHPAVEKSPHAIVGFSSAGHPIGKKGKKEIKDTKRPGKPFYCGSCHDPHSSDFMRLFRYDAKSTMGLCVHCHNI